MNTILYVINFYEVQFEGIALAVKPFRWTPKDKYLQELIEILENMFDDSYGEPVNIKLINEKKEELTFEEECSVI
jgi:hypothetical protein